MERLDSGDPRWVGGYRLLGRLGEGGMGRVYLARSERGRTVAVKAVKAELARHPDFRRRFAQEITAARRVGDTWTAPVLDADTDADEPWVATGYIAGPSLTQVVDDDFGALPEHSVRALATGLVKALHAIHAAGLIHRDLKPSNVLITIDGPKVIDFGIARALDAAAQSEGGLTRTGAVIGSPGFMSPEQVRGLPVTPASDVFCLGAVLAYAATARMPFGTLDSGIHALMFRIAEEDPDLTGMSGPLHELIAGCLSKDPEQRPTVAELVGRTQGEIPGTWLPGEVLAQLGRHAVQLLDSEDPEAMAAAAGPSAPSSPPSAPSTPPPSMPYGHSGPSTPPPPFQNGPGPYGSPSPYGQQTWHPGPQTGYQPVSPYQATAATAAPRPARSARTLGTPAWALVAVWLVWSMVHLVYYIWMDAEIGGVNEFSRPEEHDAYTSMRTGSELLEALGAIMGMAAITVWVMWFWRVRLNAEAFSPGRIRYPAGMAIGAWFLPVCNLFMPKQIANDVWAATKPTVPWAYGIRQPTQRGLLNGWWTMWVIYFCIKFAVTWDNWWDADTVDDAKGTLAVHIFADFFSIPAAVLAILLVVRLTSMQERRITGRI